MAGISMGGAASQASLTTKAQMVGFVPREAAKDIKKKQEPSIRDIGDLDDSEDEIADNMSRSLKESKPQNQQAQQEASAEQQARVKMRLISATNRRFGQETKKERARSDSDVGGPPGQLKCSFCGKSQEQVKRLIAGPGVHICDECVGQVFNSAGGGEGGANFRPMDTAAQIQWSFLQRKLADMGSMDSKPAASPEAQKKQFLSRLREMVSTEYSQYVKSDDALYSRRNLREIMQALNTDDASGRRRQSWMAANDNWGEYEGYNKFNLMRASRSMKVVQENHQPEPTNQDRLLMVA